MSSGKFSEIKAWFIPNNILFAPFNALTYMLWLIFYFSFVSTSLASYHILKQKKKKNYLRWKINYNIYIVFDNT